MELTFYDVLIRLLLATVCGGVIGIDRGKKHRPAGFRTHMLVCLGASLTMVLGIYLSVMISSGVFFAEGLPALSVDVSRFGAQVINGIGFLGAGTIIVTGKQQIKGMTTAAGLWASACMGLAIGAGFYLGALVGCFFIVSTIVFFSKLEHIIMAHSRNITLYVEFEYIDTLTHIIELIKDEQTRIFDIELTKAKGNSEQRFNSAIFSLKLPKKKRHTELIAKIAEFRSVISIEEV